MILEHISTGIARTRDAARYVGLAYAVNLALALPLGAAMASQLEAAIGRSEAGVRLLEGFDHMWYRGFDAEATGLGASFEPGLVGVGGVLKALDALVTANLFSVNAAVLAAGVLYLIAWVFLSGGFLARFTGSESAGFLSTAARHFPRVLALAAASWAVFALIFAGVLWTAADIVDFAVYDSVDERVHFAWVLGKYALVWVLAWTTSLVFDYAKIFAVARPDAPLRQCLGTAARLVRFQPRAVYGLSAGIFGIGVGALLLYAVIAPGADQHNGLKVGIAFLVSQTYILARVALRCCTLGAQSGLALRGGPP